MGLQGDRFEVVVDERSVKCCRVVVARTRAARSISQRVRLSHSTDPFSILVGTWCVNLTLSQYLSTHAIVTFVSSGHGGSSRSGCRAGAVSSAAGPSALSIEEMRAVASLLPSTLSLRDSFKELITYFACDRDESITNPTKWTPKTRGEEQRLRGQIATLPGGMEQLANLEQLLGTNFPPRTRKNGARWKKKHRDEIAAEATTPPPEGIFFLEELRKAEEGSDDEMQGAMSLIAACMASPVCVWRCITAFPVFLNRNGCL